MLSRDGHGVGRVSGNSNASGGADGGGACGSRHVLVDELFERDQIERILGFEAANFDINDKSV